MHRNGMVQEAPLEADLPPHTLRDAGHEPNDAAEDARSSLPSAFQSYPMYK